LNQSINVLGFLQDMGLVLAISSVGGGFALLDLLDIVDWENTLTSKEFALPPILV
jgi:hypothetical protein